MDNFEEIKPVAQEDTEVDALWVSEDIRSYIYETAKWARFLAIFGMVLAALTVISAMSASAVLTALSAANPGNPLAGMNPTVLTIIYLLLALVEFYPSFLLYKFSAAATQAVLYADQENFSIATSKLKSYFKFWGILVMTLIALYVLMIIVVVVGTATGKGV